MTIEQMRARWNAVWQSSGSHDRRDNVFEALATAYGAPDRHYHTLTHVADCLETLDLCRDDADDPMAIEIALWFHDAIYDTHAADNEEQSAAWAAREIGGEWAENVRRLILATKHGAAMSSDNDESFIADIDLAIQASGASMATAAPPMEPVEIYPLDEHGVRVTATLVQHAPVFPALAYRFDTPSGSAVFSGDTGPCDNLVRLAHGADYLVHEVIDLGFIANRVADLPNRDNIINHLTESHTSPEDAGRIAARAGVGTLVLSHLVPGDSEIAEEEWERRARSQFAGNVVCGVDLDQFALGT